MLKMKIVYIKLSLLVLVFFSAAPFWIPVAIAVVATTLVLAGGIVTVLAVPVSAILSFVLGVFGLPLLFSATVTAVAQFVFKIFKRLFHHHALDMENSKDQRMGWLGHFGTALRQTGSNEINNFEVDLERKDSWDDFVLK